MAPSENGRRMNDVAMMSSTHTLFFFVAIFAIGCGAKSGLSDDPDPGGDSPATDAAMAEDLTVRADTGPADLSVPLPDGEPPRPPRPCRSRAQPVDLLFVIDSSGSMEDEIASLSDQIPRFLRDMLEPPDLDGDGRADWAAVEDLHVGVVPTGRAGELVSQGDASRDECRESYPIFQTYRRGDDIERLAEGVSCVATTQFSGSEALFSTALRALLPQATTFPLPGGGAMGDTRHAGFLREESLLVLLFITDEEDESACTGTPDDECIEHCVTIAGRTLCRAPVGAVAKYVEGMRLLRTDPSQLVVGSLAGAPTDTVDPGEILRATLEANPFRPICENFPLSGLPAPRMVDFTQQLDGLFLSICAEGYEALVAPIAARVGRLACDE
jgi:hypothetical protein